MISAGLTRPPRSVTHSAGWSANPNLGRIVLDVVGDRLHRPAHHRQHVPPPRRLPPLRLAVADVQRAVTAELRCPRVAAEVGHVQPGRLGPAQPPPVDHLEDRRVPVGRQRALALAPRRALDLLVGVVQEPLQLLAGERPRLRAALVVVQVRDRVPLMADRHRVPPRAERLLARRRPAVPCVHQELGELPQRALVGADRRRRQVLLGRQVQRPLVHVPRRPRPRVLASELAEPPHQPLPVRDRVLPQPPRRLLGTPAPTASPRASRPPGAAAPPRTPAPGAPNPPGPPVPPDPPSSRNSNHLRPGSCIQRARLAITAGHTGLTCRSADGIGTACIAAKPGKLRPSDAIPEIYRRRRRSRGRSPGRSPGVLAQSTYSRGAVFLGRSGWVLRSARGRIAAAA